MSNHPAPLWFPDLCRLSRLALLMGLAQCAVVMLLLTPSSNPPTLALFLFSSVLAQWLVLSCALVLCSLRKVLSSCSMWAGSLLAMFGSGCLSFAIASMVHHLDHTLGFGILPSTTPFHFGLQCAFIVVLLLGIVIRYVYVLDQWNAQLKASAQAQVDALQARIKPHFLFNSMNTIASLISSSPKQAELAVLDLSDLFRSALGGMDKPSTLEQEVSLVKQYLAIEKLRLSDRLKVNWNTPSSIPWNTPLPRLLLQPLFENAILHGVSQTEKGGTIDVTLSVENNFLSIVIKNPVPLLSTPSFGSGQALMNVNHRLRHMYGAQSSVSSVIENNQYICTVHIPTKTVHSPFNPLNNDKTTPIKSD